MIWIYILIGLIVEFLVIVFAVALVGINKEVVFRRGKCPECGDKLLDLGKGIYFCRTCDELKALDDKGNDITEELKSFSENKKKIVNSENDNSN